MANLMRNPTVWRKREPERSTTAYILEKHQIEVERRKVCAIMYVRNLKTRQM